MTNMEQNIKEIAQRLRENILETGKEVDWLHKHGMFTSSSVQTPLESEQHMEMHANITLTYRHLEDARMRLGKTIQAFDGGTSVYPK